jgi:hypothetical protein
VRGGCAGVSVPDALGHLLFVLAQGGRAEGHALLDLLPLDRPLQDSPQRLHILPACTTATTIIIVTIQHHISHAHTLEGEDTAVRLEAHTLLHLLLEDVGRNAVDLLSLHQNNYFILILYHENKIKKAQIIYLYFLN